MFCLDGHLSCEWLAMMVYCYIIFLSLESYHLSNNWFYILSSDIRERNHSRQSKGIIYPTTSNYDVHSTVKPINIDPNTFNQSSAMPTIQLSLRFYKNYILLIKWHLKLFYFVLSFVRKKRLKTWRISNNSKYSMSNELLSTNWGRGEDLVLLAESGTDWIVWLWDRGNFFLAHPTRAELSLHTAKSWFVQT